MSLYRSPGRSRTGRAVRLVATLSLLGSGLAAAGTLAGDALAATPSSGSVSSTSATTSWTAGPFVVPNVTGTAGDVMCSPATPCDDFTLTVNTPAGYGDAHSLKIDVSWPTSAADFDVYVLDSSGQVVSSAASSSDPETILMPPTAGTYTVRVVPFAPAGQSIKGTATLVGQPVNPPPSSAPAPTYRNYAAPASLPNAHNAGEPSIGSNYQTSATMYQSYVSTYQVAFAADGAATWRNRSANAANGCPQGSTTSLDPILFTDHTTGRTFESQLAGKTALTCFTDDDGQSWTPTSGSGINSGVDHQTIGGGPFSPNSPGALTSYKHAVYYCSQDIADASCAASRDGGLTYGPAVPMYSLLDCGGLHGHVKVAPDGTVYVPNKGCGGNQAVAVSTDNGLTWTVRKNPASTPGDSDPSVGIGANGRVFMGYQNSDGTAHTTVSKNRGQTWTDDQNVGAQLGVKNIVFPTVVAGDDDRAAFAFLGTTTGGNYQDPAFAGVWHLYVSTTYDAGKTWITSDATPDNPVQKGSICTGGTTCGNDRNLLDFIDVTVGPTGRVLVGYADGCTGACASGGAQNYDALATIARQDTGLRLYAADDPQPDLTITDLARTTSSGSRLRATVKNIGTGDASGVSVRFLDRTAKVADASAGALAPGASKSVSVAYSTAGKTGDHRITAVADPLNTVKESREDNNRRVITLHLP